MTTPSPSATRSPASRPRRRTPSTELYTNLTPWQKTQVARHPQRPHCLDFVTGLITEFTPFAGDRKFAEDKAIIGGFGRFRGESVASSGTKRGRTPKAASSTISAWRGRKAIAKRRASWSSRIASNSGHTLVDTAGAYPGIDAEERGQAEAIARSTRLPQPRRAQSSPLIVGEGGSGGAIAIATANRVLMLEHAIYSVISPEGAASILWRDTSKAQDAATNMKITAEDLMRLGIIDEIIPEPAGGRQPRPAGRNRFDRGSDRARARRGQGSDRETIRRSRRDKFLNIGRSIS